MSQKKHLNLSILWVDEDLLVVNKPSGTLTIPGDTRDDVVCLLDLLEPEFGRLWVVHRLDRDTSGVQVYARNSQAHQFLNCQFERREVEKIYHAIVSGKSTWQEIVVTAPLVVNSDRDHRTIIHPRYGKPASTSLKVLGVFKNYCLIEACPHSGYTHQIRVHLSHVGLPIVGDPVYGSANELLLSKIKPDYKGSKESERPLITRTALHAHSIQFSHPTSLEKVEVKAPYPKDFSSALAQLRRYA